MNRFSKWRRKARMIKAAKSGKAKAEGGQIITFSSEAIDWVQAAAGDDADDKAKRFTMLAYTGGAMDIDYYSYPMVIDLTGLRAAPKLPILLIHEPHKIVGHADDVKIGATKIEVAGAISGAGPEADQVVASAKLGFPWLASIGVLPDSKEFIGEGVKTQINGRSFVGPIYVARKALLAEISFVPIAADNKTKVKVAATAAHQKREDENMEFNAWVELLGFSVADLTDSQTTLLHAKYDAEIKAAAETPPVTGSAAPAPSPPVLDISGIEAAHTKHWAAIEASAAGYTGKIDPAKLDPIMSAARVKATELRSTALNDEKPAVWLEVELVKAAAETRVAFVQAERPVAPTTYGSSHDLNPDVIQAALCMSAGLRKPEDHFDTETLEAAHKSYRDFGLQEVLLIAAGANGYTGRQRIGRGNVREVLEYACPIRGAGGFSTINVSGILSGTANKILLSGFDAIPQTWRQVAAIGRVGDFKTVKRYRLTTSLEYEELGPDDEIAHGELGEDTYEMAAKTYAKMLVLSRADIINDDLGAFDSLRSRLGIGASLKMNKVFWTLWINNSTFFTALLGNYRLGADSALGEVGLNKAVKLFRDMVGPDGNPMGLEPDRLICPTALEATALKWHVSTEMRDTTASSRTPVSNIYTGRFRPVAVPELGISSYTGSSATAWYLACDPQILASAVMCFLDGVEAPTIESADADFNVLGIQLRGFHDFGVAMSEGNAVVKSKGTA